MQTAPCASPQPPRVADAAPRKRRCRRRCHCRRCGLSRPEDGKACTPEITRRCFDAAVAAADDDRAYQRYCRACQGREARAQQKRRRRGSAAALPRRVARREQRDMAAVRERRVYALERLLIRDVGADAFAPAAAYGVAAAASACYATPLPERRAREGAFAPFQKRCCCCSRHAAILRLSALMLSFVYDRAK